jgi:hypothetical protein
LVFVGLSNVGCGRVARHEQRQFHVVAAVQRQRLDSRSIHNAVNSGRHDLARLAHDDGFADGTQGERHVELPILADGHGQPLGAERGEAIHLHFDVVDAGRQDRKRVAPVRPARRRDIDAGGLVMGRHHGTRDRRLLRIRDASTKPDGRWLRPCGDRDGEGNDHSESPRS